MFTGYSSLAVALALPDDGRIVACDVSEEWTAVARRYWAEAGVAHKVELRLAPALETLDSLLAAGEAAASTSHSSTPTRRTTWATTSARSNCCDRADWWSWTTRLWSGRVADPAIDDADTVALRHFNELLHHDDRVDLSLLPVGDGLTLARKK